MSGGEPMRLWRAEYERMNAESVFKMFDRDKNQSLDIKELRQVFHALGNNKTDKEMEEIMKAADKDGSGTIDYEEYKQLLQTYLKDPQDEEIELRDAFRMFDKERTGKLSKKKLRRFMQLLPDLFTEEDEDQIDKLLADMDQDNDGHIDIEELVQYICKKTV